MAAIDVGPTLRTRNIGGSEPRIEDDRLVSGNGRFVADLHIPGMCEVVFVRSPVAHAVLDGVDKTASAAMPGVVSVVTASDLVDVRPFPDYISTNRSLEVTPLARDRLRSVGAPVAAVVATDRYLAEDAAGHVNMAYTELPVVLDIDRAVAADAPQLYEAWGDNLITHVDARSETVTKILRSGLEVVSGRFKIHRHGPVPLETSAILAEYRQGRLTVWATAQSPHIMRTILSESLGLVESRIRVIAPDVGGSFGAKCHVYREQVVVAWLAMHLGRPIRYLEDRRENLMNMVHARDQLHELEAAVNPDGTIAALRARIVQDIGSGEVWYPGTSPTWVSMAHQTSSYKIPAFDYVVENVVTNKTPSGAYRGFGAPEAVFAIERLIEKIASVKRLDSHDLRRRMLITETDLPYETPTGAVCDSGTFLAAFDKAAEIVEVAYNDALAVRTEPHIAIGKAVVPFIEGTTPTYRSTTGRWSGGDALTVRIESDGSVTAATGLSTTGQGVTTAVATLLSDALGVDRSHVQVEIGDTDTTPYGLGGWGSRSASLASTLVRDAADEILNKARQIAGHLLEASPDDLIVADGVFTVRGSGGTPSITWADVATIAVIETYRLPPGVDPGLSSMQAFEPQQLEHQPRPDGKMRGSCDVVNATHGAVVAVDTETGEVEVLSYVVAHDCGVLINPVIVDGQINGGVAQEIGGTLLEHFVYDDHGQPLATSFMDYLLPTAMEIPEITKIHFETPSPNNPFGVKGAGEGGTIGVAAALTNSVCHALREFGVSIDETPITPSRVRKAIKGGTS